MGTETLVHLAVQVADKPRSTKGLAEWINRSVSYTETLMAQLRNAGPVVSRQGHGGGYVLARPADRIAVAEVSEAVDAPSDLASRPLNAEMLEAEDIDDLHGEDLPWKSLKSYVLLFLNGVFLADLVPERPKLIGDIAHDNDLAYPGDMGSTVRH
jgi:Rrf2 family protein